MAKSGRNTANQIIIVAAIIGAIATIIGGLLAGPLVLKLLQTPASERLAIHVTDDSGASISGAKALLFFAGGSLSAPTDTNGTASFDINPTSRMRLIIETDKFEIYEQDIQMPRNEAIVVRLKQRTGTEASVLFRVVDDTTAEPVSGAKILLLAQGDILSQLTDSNGISRFTLAFPSDAKIDARMSVSTNAYQVNDQNITLTPNRVQDVRLNPNKKTLKLADVATQIPPTQQSRQSQTTATATPTRVQGGVAIKSTASTIVDPKIGFSVTTERITSEKDQGELKVILRTPDNQPLVGTYVAIFKQKIDLNNQPIQGDRAAEFRTDNGGSGVVVLPPGNYGIYPEIAGNPWREINFNQRVDANTRTTIVIVPSRLIIAIRRADGSLITNSNVSVSTQKRDVNGNPLADQRVGEARTRDTGDAKFDLFPGAYVIYLEAARGEDWGSLDNVLPPATQLTYNLTLGRIRIESRDDKGKVASGFYSRVTFPKKDANNNLITGDNIIEGRTDDAGILNFDLTPGMYIVVSEVGIKTVQVQSGETIILKNTDFTKP